MISAASSALGNNLGLGDNLALQVKDESEEVRRRRAQAAKDAGYSPAGASLVGQGAMSAGPL
jgi:hypothetical protein